MNAQNTYFHVRYRLAPLNVVVLTVSKNRSRLRLKDDFELSYGNHDMATLLRLVHIKQILLLHFLSLNVSSGGCH